MPEVLSFSTAEETHDAVAAYLFEGITAFFEYVDEVHVAVTSGVDAAQASLSLLKLMTQQSVSGIVHLWWLDEQFVAHDDTARKDRYTADLVENFRLGGFVQCHRAPTPSDGSLAEVRREWEAAVTATEFAFAVIGTGLEGERMILSPGAALTTVSHSANIAIVATGVERAADVDALLNLNLAHPIGQVAALEHTSIWLDDAAARKDLTQN